MVKEKESEMKRTRTPPSVSIEALYERTKKDRGEALDTTTGLPARGEEDDDDEEETENSDGTHSQSDHDV